MNSQANNDGMELVLHCFRRIQKQILKGISCLRVDEYRNMCTYGENVGEVRFLPFIIVVLIESNYSNPFAINIGNTVRK